MTALNWYAPIRGTNDWMNITDLNDTVRGHLTHIGGVEKLIVVKDGKTLIGNLWPVNGKRRYWVEAENELDLCTPYYDRLSINGRIFHKVSSNFNSYYSYYNGQSIGGLLSEGLAYGGSTITYFKYTGYQLCSGYNKNVIYFQYVWTCTESGLVPLKRLLWDEATCTTYESNDCTFPVILIATTEAHSVKFQTVQNPDYSRIMQYAYLVDGVWSDWYTIPTS
jgi:hypothetical protein